MRKQKHHSHQLIIDLQTQRIHTHTRKKHIHKNTAETHLNIKKVESIKTARTSFTF